MPTYQHEARPQIPTCSQGISGEAPRELWTGCAGAAGVADEFEAIASDEPKGREWSSAQSWTVPSRDAETGYGRARYGGI